MLKTPCFIYSAIHHKTLQTPHLSPCWDCLLVNRMAINFILSEAFIQLSGVISAIAMKEDNSLLRVDFKRNVPQKLILNSFLPLSSLSCLVDLLSCLQLQLFSCGMNVVSFKKRSVLTCKAAHIFNCPFVLFLN